METKRKTAVAVTTTVKNMRENDTTHNSRIKYSTFKGKLQGEIAKFLCIASFGFMYGMFMYALWYICGVMR